MKPGQLTIVENLHLALLPALRAAILERSHRERSHGSNNVGGWKSGADLFTWPDAAFGILRDDLVARIGCNTNDLYGWAMVNRAGSEHKRHTHGLMYTCGVFYVSSGSPMAPTVFELDGELAAKRIGPRDQVAIVLPIPGRLVLFSGATPHRVPRYDGTEPRITIAIEARR